MQRRRLRDFARRHRASPTPAERLLWSHLRARRLRNFKFRRQRPMGPYIVDFVSLNARLVIEVDGGQHAHQTTADARRTSWLLARGFQILRFWNHEVLYNLESVMRSILDRLPAVMMRP